MFAVEYAGTGWQVRNKATGLLVACRIPTFEQAQYQADYFSARPSRRGKGFATWHSKTRQRGPTTVQRPIKGAKPVLGPETPGRKYA